MSFLCSLHTIFNRIRYGAGHSLEPNVIEVVKFDHFHVVCRDRDLVFLGDSKRGRVIVNNLIIAVQQVIFVQ